MANALDYIPEIEHAAIRDFTSTYDCTADLQAAIDMEGVVVLPIGRYNISTLVMPSHSGIIGEGFMGSGAAPDFRTSGARLNLTGPLTGYAAGIVSTAGVPMVFTGFRNFNVCVAENVTGYVYMMQFTEPVGCTWQTLRLHAHATGCGGIQTSKIDPDNVSWVNRFDSVFVKLPYDNPGAYSLHTDMGDCCWTGGSLTGGSGVFMKGTGHFQLIGSRIDHSSDFGLRIVKEKNAQCSHGIIGNQFEQNSIADIRIDADYDDTLTSRQMMPVIVGNQFRSADAMFAIHLKNATGANFTHGPAVVGNVQNITSKDLIRYNSTDWQKVVVSGNQE